MLDKDLTTCGLEIKIAYESIPNTNVFTDAEKEIVNAMVAPTTTTAFNIGVTDGTFQPVTIPTDCKSILIQISNGVITDFTSYQDNPLGFHFSTSGDEAAMDYINCVGSFEIENWRTAGDIIGYVRAASGGQMSGVVAS